MIQVSNDASDRYMMRRNTRSMMRKSEYCDGIMINQSNSTSMRKDSWKALFTIPHMVVGDHRVG